MPSPTSTVLAMEAQNRRRIIASYLDEIIAIHRHTITAETPTKEYPLSNAVRDWEAGSLVWQSSSFDNLHSDLNRKNGFIGSEYVVLGPPGSEEWMLRFYMTYGSPSERHGVPIVGEVLVTDHDVLQFCGARTPGDDDPDLTTILTKIIRFITPENILTLLKSSVAMGNSIIFKVVPVGEELASQSENKELKVGQWILEARTDDQMEGWKARPLRSEATWLVRRFDERAFPHPYIPGNAGFSGTQAARRHLYDEEIGPMRESMELWKKVLSIARTGDEVLWSAVGVVGQQESVVSLAVAFSLSI